MSLILVVDDEPGVRLTIREWLESEGFAVETTGGLAETMAWFARADEPPDAMLLDIKLSDGNGFDLADRLKAEHGFDRVIYITAFFWEDETRGQLSDRGDPYFEKPLKFADQVIPFLRRYLVEKK